MVTTDHALPSDQDFARLEKELFGRLETRQVRRVRRHRLVVAASVVLLSTAGVAGVTQANQTVVSNAAYCYASANTGSKNIQLQLGDASGNDGTSTTASARHKLGSLAERSCGLAWSTGSLSSSTKIPHLQACVRNDQVFAVFPKRNSASADAFCTNLGMSAT